MEYLDIVDAEGRPTGEVVGRGEAHQKGIPHRTAHVWVVRKNGDAREILLQKRTMDKDAFPGFYDTSSAGHIPAGEEPLPSALRELQEELGITAAPEELVFAGKFRAAFEGEFHGQPFRNDEITWVYIYSGPVEIEDLVLQASEVDEVRWFDLEAVREEIRTDRRRFCIPSASLEILKEHLS